MKEIILSELKKQKRTKMLVLSFLSILAVSLLSLLLGLRIVSFGFEVDNKESFFMEQLLFWNSFYIFPALLVLVGSHSITRERTEGTLNQLLLIPVSYSKVLYAKFLVLFLLMLVFSLFAFMCAIFNQFIVFKNIISITLFFEFLKAYIVNGVCLLISVAPIISLSSYLKNDSLILVGVSVMYSFLGVFITNSSFNMIYPISASLGIAGMFSLTNLEILKAIISYSVCIIFTIININYIQKKIIC
ncbi:ABC transporter permease [Lysinibacillus xylanilyticus]|uniref:ABC transporter permease n=1 Tax=Lysinibacillus xylanilyticus TaxID=582475 RepID=UPI0037F37C08